MGIALPPLPKGIQSDSFTELPLSALSSAVVPVLVAGNSYFEYIGTAFNIAPDGLFVTARHVVEDAEQKQREHPGSFIAILWIGSGEEQHDVDEYFGGMIAVSAYTNYEYPASDLAILRAGMLNTDTNEPLIMPVMRLSTHIPQVGENIICLGYPTLTSTMDEQEQGETVVTVDQTVHAATNRIADVFIEGRDTVMMPAAGFQTEAVIEGGMSGGPILNEAGYVCGVASFSLRPDEEYTKYTSFAALAISIYPLFIDDGTQRMTVFQMAEMGIVATDDGFTSLEYVDENGHIGVRRRANT